MLTQVFRWRPMLRLCVGAALICGIIDLLGGCAAVIPVAGDVVGPAIEQTGEMLSRGKVESFQAVPMDEAVAAVRKAAATMALKHVSESKHPDQLKLTYADDRGQKIVVTVVRRTSKVSGIHADVGILGVEGMSALMVREIIADLPAMKTPMKNAGP